MIDHKSFFESYGQIRFTMEEDERVYFTVEELAQAIEARMLEKMAQIEQEKAADAWGDNFDKGL